MILLLAAVATLAASGGAVGSAEGAPRISRPASAYLQNCGGCHGINGTSSDIAVPSLLGQVGSFLCLPEGRRYIVRLPNVALAPVSDKELAELMNFVIAFDPKPSMPGAGPYTAAEVGELRRNPLIAQTISVQREALVKEMIGRCGAPRSLLTYK